MTEEYILKQRLQELIGNAKVTSAVFYTFNFDPKFFENYVMPLLVPDQQFINNAITNNIIWRRLYKDDKVPPVTVYCDQYAKSIENGPMLDYKIVEVNMPSVGKNKGNFHPKQSFILLNRQGEESMILITGSNNITQNGWCENKECISEHVLTPTKYFPELLKKEIQNFVKNIGDAYNKNYSTAEYFLLQFLNKRGVTKDKEIYFYDSFQMPFKEFLDDTVFSGNTIKQVEIISPFFKNDVVLVEYLKTKKIEVKIEAPFRDAYCILDPELYSTYIKAGVSWFAPSSERHVHSKVYRFYNSEFVYTFIGSVNFTAPAWRGVPELRKEVYNIESGILYVEKADKQQNLFKNELIELPPFLPISCELENTFEERINAPSISFIINWTTKIISWKGKITTNCKLLLPTGIEIQLQNNGSIALQSFPHFKEILEALSKRTLLEVKEQINDEERHHHYYANQEGFEQKPLEYRLSSTDILDAWDLLGEEDELIKEWLLSRLEQYTDLAQDESGKIVNDVSDNKSLLNEMARHFYGLIKLEEFLYNNEVFKKSGLQKSLHGKALGYYLIHDNVDTLPSYIKDIEKLYNEEKLLGGYYWLLLIIIQNNFYLNPLLKRFMRECLEPDNKIKFSKQSQISIHDIGLKLQLLQTHLNVDKNKLNWALEFLTDDRNK